jgi:hypothetical protein
MAGRLIWFFGPSAAGKRTLLEAAAHQLNHPLRMYLDLGTPVEICAQSLISDRADFAKAIAAADLRRPGLTQLIKGQSIDIWDWEPQRDVPGILRGLLPDCREEVVFVWAPPAELHRRCVERAEHARQVGNDQLWRYWSQQTTQTCRQELELQLRWVRALELEISWVKSEGSIEIGSEPPT